MSYGFQINTSNGFESILDSRIPLLFGTNTVNIPPNTNPADFSLPYPEGWDSPNVNSKSIVWFEFGLNYLGTDPAFAQYYGEQEINYKGVISLVYDDQNRIVTVGGNGLQSFTTGADHSFTLVLFFLMGLE